MVGTLGTREVVPKSIPIAERADVTGGHGTISDVEVQKVLGALPRPPDAAQEDQSSLTCHDDEAVECRRRRR